MDGLRTFLSPTYLLISISVFAELIYFLVFLIILFIYISVSVVFISVPGVFIYYFCFWRVYSVIYISVSVFCPNE